MAGEIGNVSRETLFWYNLVKAVPSRQGTLRKLMTAYKKEIGAAVSPDTDGLDAWFHSDSRWPFFILTRGHIAGFALVQRHSYLDDGDDFSIADFYILPEYRKGGLGQRAIDDILETFRGPWQFKWHPGNALAASFWKKAVARYAGSGAESYRGVQGMVYSDGERADVQRFDTSKPPSKIRGFLREVHLRPETPEDYHTMEEMTRRAFWNKYAPGCTEHYVLHLMREDSSFLPGLSRVAEKGDKLLGGIWYCMGQVRGAHGAAKVPMFGPVTVLPQAQGQGIGTLLIEKTLSLATEAGYPAVIIFGDPGYYSRFGFVPCKLYGITTAQGHNMDAFMVKELRPGALSGVRGAFHAPAFYEASPAQAERFDAPYPYREKLILPGQLQGE